MEGEKNPSEVMASYERGELSRDTTISLLIMVIENDNRRRVRVESLQLLGKVAQKNGKFIEFLEELIISDVDEVVRSVSARVLVEKFPNESMDTLEWVLKNEMSLSCIEEILEGLSMNDANYLTLILRNMFTKHLEEKENQLDNIRHFFSELERLLSRIPLNQIPLAELREIYLNYKVLVNLEQKYHLSQDYIDCFSWGGYITKLDLSGQNIRSISEIEGWLARLTRLEVLDLKANKIMEITGLEHCKSLEILKLQWNQIDKIEGLDFLTNLSSINLAENQIREIQGLQNLISLSRLELGSNKISRISGLETLRNLDYLDLAGNSITEISSLENLNNLRELNLVNNQISEIKGLKNLKNLKSLDLSLNQIREIKVLKYLKSLEYLVLEVNHISRIEGIKKLKKLDYVNLDLNKIPKKELIEFYNNFENKKKRDLRKIKS